jgi:hypothetical protein
MSFEETTFKTVDGVELHARVYAAAHPGPGLVMCPGVSLSLLIYRLSS